MIRENKVVPITPKLFDILLLLVENSGSLITKETLLEKIWPNAFVEEANLSVNVASLRKTLGNDHQYIETVPKGGYRFVAAVRRLQPNENISSPPAAKLAKEKLANNVETAGQLKSLAILPFDNGSENPAAEYLSEGLTESIINNLSQLSALRVVARNSVFRYKNSKLSASAIARHLGVHLVVSGRILQLADRIIIRTELVDMSSERQLWGGQFHRRLSDVLAVQQEISEEVSKALEFQLTREERNRLTKHYTDNSEAYHLYLKGRYHWNKFNQVGLRTAVEFFVQAIDIDPTYALAYAGLADCYYRMSNVYAPSSEAMPKAKASAIKALDIDPNLSEGHAALGLAKLFYELDWPGAESAFRRAIEINPQYSTAHQRLGLYFSLLTRFEDAAREYELARQIDPLSQHLAYGLALMFFLARDYERALSEVQTTLEMDSNYVPTLYLLGRTYEQLGKIDQAVEVFEKILALNDSAPTFLAALGHVHAISGKKHEAKRILEQLRERARHSYVSSYCFAVIHLALGDRDEALSCLERAFEERSEMMTWLKIDPHLDEIRSYPRFRELMHRAGLAEDYQAYEELIAS